MPRYPWKAIAVVAAFVLPAPSALAHEGNPNYRSEIHGIDPATPGVEATVLGFDDRLELENRGNQVVVVQGYEDEPYLRFLPDGTVEVNTRSPAYYLNRDRFAKSDVPNHASENATPEWTVVGRDGHYSWHDHRAHYMARGTPSQVTDEDKRTKVFDYRVPIDIEGRSASITGTLYWAGEDGGFPIALVAIGIAGVIAIGGLGVVLVHRRRAGVGREPPKEAW
jgi:hypothetical protein